MPIESEQPAAAWSDAWKRQQRKWIILPSIFLAFTVIVTLAHCLFFIFLIIKEHAYSTYTPYGPWTSNVLVWMLLIGFVPLALVCAFVVPFIIRARRIYHRVPDADGYVCLRCIRQLTPCTDDHTHGCCARCGRTYLNSAVRAYWEMYPVKTKGGYAYRRLLLSLMSRSGKPTLSIRVYRQLRAFNRHHKVWRRLLVYGCPPAVGLTLIIFTIGSMFGEQLLFMMFIMTVCTAAGLLTKRRMKSTVRSAALACTACQYQLAPTGPRPDRCPECGEDWRVFGATQVVQLRKQGNTLSLQSTALVIAGLLVGFTALPILSNYIYGVIPTSILLMNVDRSRWYDSTAWYELVSRPLTEDQTEHLAEVLIRKRMKYNYLDSNESTWLNTVAASDRLPPELADQSYASAFTPELLVRLIEPGGPRLNLKVLGTYRDLTSNSPDLITIFAGDVYLQVGPTRTLLGSIRKAERALYVEDRYSTGGRKYALHTAINNDLIAGLESAQITVDVWVVHAPESVLSEETAQWNDADGTPILPDGITWSKHYTLSEELHPNGQ